MEQLYLLGGEKMKYYLALFGIVIVDLACLCGAGLGLYLVIHSLFMWSKIAGGIALGLVIIYVALSILAWFSAELDRHNAKQGDL